MTHNHHHSGCEVVEGVGMGWRACLEGWLVGWMVEQEGVFGGLVGCLVPTREWIVALWPPACPLCLPPACSQNTKPCIYVCVEKKTQRWSGASRNECLEKVDKILHELKALSNVNQQKGIFCWKVPPPPTRPLTTPSRPSTPSSSSSPGWWQGRAGTEHPWPRLRNEAVNSRIPPQTRSHTAKFLVTAKFTKCQHIWNNHQMIWKSNIFTWKM